MAAAAAEKKVKVKWLGDGGRFAEYHGLDGEDENGHQLELHIGEGQEVEVSAEKAAQLAEDFPQFCVVDGKGPVKKAGRSSSRRATKPAEEPAAPAEPEPNAGDDQPGA